MSFSFNELMSSPDADPFFSSMIKKIYLYFTLVPPWNWWLKARLQYLQCISNWGTAVLHKAITTGNCGPAPSFGFDQETMIQTGCFPAAFSLTVTDTNLEIISDNSARSLVPWQKCKCSSRMLTKTSSGLFCEPFFLQVIRKPLRVSWNPFEK